MADADYVVSHDSLDNLNEDEQDGEEVGKSTILEMASKRDRTGTVGHSEN